jgi:transcriptional regulator with XRE-family HTH domain
MVTPGQIRAGRGLLGWSQAELGQRSGDLSARAISLIETSKTDPHASTFAAIIAALEAGGVEFLPDGVRKVEWSPTKNGIQTSAGAVRKPSKLKRTGWALLPIKRR